MVVEISGEKFMDLRYILDVDIKEFVERLVDLMKDGERRGRFVFLVCLFEYMVMVLIEMRVIGWEIDFVG